MSFCDHCSQGFMRAKRWQRFCSDSCQRRARNERLKEMRQAARRCPCGAPPAHAKGLPRCAACKRAARLGYERRKMMGVTQEQFDAAFAAQGRVCAICGSADAQRKGSKAMAADHCHATGAFRGVLCHKCNIGLGLFGDNPNLLKAAHEYLTVAVHLAA